VPKRLTSARALSSHGQLTLAPMHRPGSGPGRGLTQLERHWPAGRPFQVTILVGAQHQPGHGEPEGPSRGRARGGSLREGGATGSRHALSARNPARGTRMGGASTQDSDGTAAARLRPAQARARGRLAAQWLASGPRPGGRGHGGHLRLGRDVRIHASVAKCAPDSERDSGGKTRMVADSLVWSHVAAWPTL
jgi:hypothetical protein